MEGFCFKGSRLFLVNVKSLGGGELSLSACPEVGNRTSIEEKITDPRGCAGGMVEAKIEPWKGHIAKLCPCSIKR